MATTPHLGITKIEQSQAQKEVTTNESLIKIDALLNMAVADRDLTTPPGSPSEGDVYIPAATATGDWTGHEGKIVYYESGAWNVITPNEGLQVWIADEDVLVVYDGSAWGAPDMQNVSLLGVNTTADTTNKLAVASAAVLFDNIGANSQVKVNKAAAGDTSSHLFQNNYSGRAEFGLIGNDDFTLKVSPNGSTWYDAFIVDKDTGEVEFQQPISVLGDYSVIGQADALQMLVQGAAGQTASIFKIQTNGGSQLFLCTASGNIQITGYCRIGAALDHDGSTVGFYGTTPVAQATGFTTFTNLSSVKTLDADSTTLDEVADVLGTFIEAVKATGLIAA